MGCRCTLLERCADQHTKAWLLLGPIPAQEADAKPNVNDARKSGLEQDLDWNK